MKFLRNQTIKIRVHGEGVQTEKKEGTTICNIGINEPLYIALNKYTDCWECYVVSDFKTGLSYGSDCEDITIKGAIKLAIAKIDRLGEKTFRNIINRKPVINNEADYPGIEKLQSLRKK